MKQISENHSPQLVSIVIPVMNESANLALLLERLQAVFQGQPDYQFEIVFVDDGSTDDTADKIVAIGRKNSDVRLIELSRNFGKEMAVTAGLAAATGDAAIIIDADLQHPPEMIPKFIAAWAAGAEVVIGVRTDDKRYASFMKRLGSKLFYKLINNLSPVKIVPNATDYRLIDRVVIDAFNQFSEHNRMTRGLIDWLGFKREYVTFTPVPRQNGEAGYNLRKLTGLALNSIVGMSLVPLKFAGYLGVAITLIFGTLGVSVAVEMFGFNDPWHLNIANSVNLAILIVFLIGIVLMALGLVGLYIAAIHTEVSGRPLYVKRPRR